MRLTYTSMCSLYIPLNISTNPNLCPNSCSLSSIARYLGKEVINNPAYDKENRINLIKSVLKSHPIRSLQAVIAINKIGIITLITSAIILCLIIGLETLSIIRVPLCIIGIIGVIVGIFIMLLGYLLEQWELDNCIPIEEDDLYDEVYGKYFDYIENYDFVKKLHYPYPDDALIKRRILEEEQ